MAEAAFLVLPKRDAEILCKELSREGANLSGAHLYRADLSCSVLMGADLSRTNLRKAKLRGCSGLDSAVLSGALYDGETLWPDDFPAEFARKAGAVFSPAADNPVFVTPSAEPGQDNP